MDTAFWTFEVESVVNISTHALFTTRIHRNSRSLQAVLTRCQPKLGILEKRDALVVAIITYNDRLHDNCLKSCDFTRRESDGNRGDFGSRN